MRYVLVSAVVWSVFISTAFAQTADEFMPKLKAEIKEEGDLKLDWCWQPYVAGNLFFMSVHRNGSINSFRRDEQTGDIKILESVDVAKDLGNPGRHRKRRPRGLAISNAIQPMED